MPQGEAPAKPAAATLPQAAVLIVDDHPRNLLALEAVLESLEVNLVRATHGTEALALLRERNFAVTLMDVRMPDLDGFEVTRLAREAGDRTPVIFVTATPEDAHVTRRGYAGGGVDFMVKPFDADILRWKVRAFVEIWQQQEQLRRETAAHKAELERGRLAGLLAQSPAAIAITRGSDYVFEFVNPLFEKVMGRRIELGSTLAASLPELTTQPKVTGALQQVLSSGESFVGREFEMLLHRGPNDALERAFFDLVFQPVRDAQERVTHVLTHAVEVTEYVRAREHLRESENRFRALTEALPLLVYSARAEGGAPDYYNSRWYEYTGLPAGSLDDDAWERVCHPEDLPTVRARWQQSHVSGGPFECELRLRRADGVYRWHLARSAPQHDVSGRVTRWLGTSTDIDEQKRAHDVQEFLADVSVELSTSLDYETTLQRVAKLVVPRFADWCAVDVLDGQGAVERLAVEHLDPEKVALAHELHRRYPADLQAEHGLAAVLRNGKSEWMADIPDALLVASAKDPEQLRIARALGLKSYITVPLKRGARVFGAITVVQAESGRRYSAGDLAVIEELALRASLAIENARLFRTAEQLNETLEQRVRERTLELEEANRELESFSYSVSHDLRAPLRHITGFAQLLEKRAHAQLDETSRKFVQTISASAQQGGKLVDDLLSFSRMGRSELKKTHVPLAQIVNQARKDLDPETHERVIHWEVAELPDVFIDPNMLRLVFRNLLSNAIKYTRPKPEARIRIQARQLEGEVEVTVEDNGVGFEMEYVDKLFGVFQRLHTADQFEGTGIGLANVRRIIQRHGGRVWATATVGEGASFTFTLPLAPSAKEHNDRA